MYKLMQKYNKKLLAIVMVFLMVAFVIPQFSKSPTPSTVAAGTLGDETITMQDVRNGHAYWGMLTGHELPAVVVQEMDPQTGQPTLAPLAQQLGAAVVNEIEKHPVMFVLLQKEAEKNGISVSDSDLDDLLSRVQVRLSDRTVQYDDIRNVEDGDNVRNAARQFLLVSTSFEQALRMIKVSQPLLASRMAKELQEIKLNLVEFDTKDYVDKVPPATPDQISAQFNKYGDILSSEADLKTNPFGFGYKYPDRVKVAYIAIASSEVKKTVRASKSDYDWEVLAQRYYKNHGSEFASTQPATTNPTDTLSLGATSRPTTQPFAAVRDVIIDQLIQPEAAKLESQIQSRITSQTREDWNTYHAAISKSPPTTAPTSSLGVAYNSPDYLSKLGAEIQSQFKVVPTVQTLADKFRTTEELGDLPGIGKASAEFGQQSLPFNLYASKLVAAFIKNPSPDMFTPIQTFEPSRPLNDMTGDAMYVFRIIDADPSHKPADSRDVLQQVEDDIRKQAAYDLAKADADKLLTAAKTTSLAAAAASASKREITPSYIQAVGTLPTEVPVSSTSRLAFVDQAFQMLASASSEKSVMKLVGLPRDSKLFVAQLADVRRIPLFAGQSLEPQLTRQIVGELGRDLYQQWYRYDSVVQRTHFVDASKKKDSES